MNFEGQESTAEHTTETGVTEVSELWAIATVARAAATMMERMVASGVGIRLNE